VILNTTDSIQAFLAGAITTTQPDYVVSWTAMVDTVLSKPDNATGTLNSTTPVTLAAAPASGQRLVRTIAIYNRDTASATVTVVLDVSGTDRYLYKATLATGESLHYGGAGSWYVANAAGIPITTERAASDIQVFTTAGAATWTKPTTFTPKWVTVVAYGAGGSGGGGASATGALVRCGGGGGGGGAGSQAPLAP